MEVLVEGVELKAKCPSCSHTFKPRKREKGSVHRCRACGSTFRLYLPDDVQIDIQTKPSIKKELEVKQLTIRDIVNNSDFHEYWDEAVSNGDPITVEGYFTWQELKR